MIFGGSNTPDGELGCVSMEWQGKVKPYRCRNISDIPVMKHAFVAKDAIHAIVEFDNWNHKIKSARRNWKRII